MSRKITTHDFSGMTDRELHRAYETHLHHAEVSLIRGREGLSHSHSSVARELMDELFRRIETQLDDWGDSSLDRRS